MTINVRKHLHSHRTNIWTESKTKEKKIPVICFPKGLNKNYLNFNETVKPDGISLDYEVDPIWAKKTLTNVVFQGGMSPKILLQNDKEIYDEALRSGAFTNHSIGVNIPVVSEDGYEWVLLWDIADAGGQTTRYQEAFRIEDGKIVQVNQFSKPVLDDDSDEDHDGDDNDGEDHHDGDDND